MYGIELGEVTSCEDCPLNVVLGVDIQQQGMCVVKEKPISQNTERRPIWCPLQDLGY